LKDNKAHDLEQKKNQDDSGTFCCCQKDVFKNVRGEVKMKKKI
jgi:hypothetical protein